MKKQISDWRGAKGEWQTARASGSSRWLRQGVRSCIRSLRRWVGARSNSLNLGACWGAHGCAKSEVAENNGWACARIRASGTQGGGLLGVPYADARKRWLAAATMRISIFFFGGGDSPDSHAACDFRMMLCQNRTRRVISN